MKKLVALLLGLLISFSAIAAEYIANSGSATITLQPSVNCPAAIAAQVPQTIRPRLHAAYAVIEGTKYPACFAEENGIVYLIYEDGDIGAIHSTEFRKLKEA